MIGKSSWLWFKVATRVVVLDKKLIEEEPQDSTLIRREDATLPTRNAIFGKNDWQEQLALFEVATRVVVLLKM